MSKSNIKNKEVIKYKGHVIPTFFLRSVSFLIDFGFIFLITDVILDIANIEAIFKLKALYTLIGLFIYEPILNAKYFTLGQLLTNIRVRDFNNTDEKLNIPKAFLRYIIKIPLLILSALSMGYNKERRAIHDAIVSSVVIEGDNPVILNFFKSKYTRFIISQLIFIPWVIWIGNFWLLIGIPIFIDLYITKKVNWSFWKKRDKKNNKAVEWADAIIFAVVAATLIRMFFIEAFTIPTSSMEKSLLVGDYLFVSKFNYGPKLPNTPLSFPFAHHTLPLTKDKKSYLEWIKWPYKRIAGLEKIENNDVVVFNYPEGDTVITEYGTTSYYDILQQFTQQYKNNDRSRNKPLAYYENLVRKDLLSRPYVVRPVDKRENYIKRCVAIPGDTIEIMHSELYINGKLQNELKNKQHKYVILSNNNKLGPKAIRDLGISNEDTENPSVLSRDEYAYFVTNHEKLKGKDPYKMSMYPLSEEKAEKLKKYRSVKEVIRYENIYRDSCFAFPKNHQYNWNGDNLGPLVIPKKGATVKLNTKTLPLYKRIIDLYEDNDLEVKGDKIFVNGEEVNSYTFNMDYYWMMGDNRHNSLDSRFWGFVPEDHIVGKAIFVWLSLEKDKSLFNGKIRWNKLFRNIE